MAKPPNNPTIGLDMFDDGNDHIRLLLAQIFGPIDRLMEILDVESHLKGVV